MTKARDIRDEDSLKAWLETQPREVSALIASRAALRVMPVWADYCLFGRGKERDVTPVPVLWANLISSVVAVSPTDDMKAPARAAASAIYASASAYAASASAYAAYGSASATYDSAFGATATGAVVNAAAVTASSAVWSAVRSDALAIEAGKNVTTAPLWPGEGAEANPLADLWHKVATQGFTPDSPYDFWRRWYDTLLDPARHPPMPHDMLYEIALIDPEIWEGAPEDLAREIAGIEARYVAPKKTALAKAGYFDFIAADKQLRMIGVEADFESLTDEQIAECRKKLREWAEELQDWRDYAQDEVSGNRPSTLLRVVDKILDHIARDPSSEEFSVRRYISLGSDLRRISLDENQRDRVGDTLAEMLDGRIYDFSRIGANCFGQALEGLAPLNEMELGDNVPEVLIEIMQKGLAAIREADPEVLAQVEPEGRAILDAAIEAAENPKTLAVLRKRFAEKYAGVSATIGRSLEKGREVAGAAASKFDDAVKWFKRWETLEKIIDWWSSLPPSAPGL